MTSAADEVNDLIRALRAGSMTLEEVARRFRERDWPSTSPPLPKDYLEMADQAMEDPEPDVPGSFDDVVAAYDRRELSDEEFDVLSDAVAESKRAKHQQN
jgi:hypothetical protein